jgi:hypothetical protein
MPALLLAVLAVIQVALWEHAQHVAQAAARQGAETARGYGGTEQAGQQRALDSLDRFGPTVVRDPRVNVVRTPTEVTVTVTGEAASVLGLFRFGIHEQARSGVERFVPLAGAP